ncbi:MAG: glycosyl transferase, group 1 [Microgenomates group bacterium Gr01-1014_16]|nr:MAG: glycosyl transferase, group 1 [Microgenomates group bacterium Gr01-1014_16]
MRIGVDYRLANRHLGGMAVYLRNLIPLLKKIDSQNEYLLFSDNPSGRPGFKRHAWTIIWEHIWLQLCLPFLFWKEKINVAYFPNPPVSFFLTIPMVLTIPDVSFMYDLSMPGWTKGYLWIMYFLSAHKARTITTFSQNSSNDIVKFFKVELDKIYVTPLAPSNALSLQKTKREPQKEYILTVPGTFISRKNIEETILAFKHLPAILKNTYRLIVVGDPHGEGYEKIKDFVEVENMTEKVILAGRVSDHELSALYSRSKLFVCSSLYEGFGLPILEAMKCGVPVISYDNSSLPEVVGDVGILVKNVDELSRAMEEVLINEKLQVKLKSRGLKRASLYGWDKTAISFLTSLPKNAY